MSERKWESGWSKFKVELESTSEPSFHGSFKATNASPRDLGVSSRLKCIKCGSVTELTHCSNCNHYGYNAGFSTDRVAGLFCAKCSKGFTYWQCSKCSTKNPIDNSIEVEKSGCFIATAVYGSYSAPEVKVLRRFRDDILQSSRSGQKFVKLYYFISPSIADFLINKSKLRSFVRKSILTPFVIYVENKLSK